MPPFTLPDPDETWFVDNVALNTLAYNIQTWGGSRQSPPSFRGSDYAVPYRPGAVFVPKTPDSRVITLAMWVQGLDPTTEFLVNSGVMSGGTNPTTGSAITPSLSDIAGANRKRFLRNWNTLRSLLWTPNRQIALKKIFYDYTSDSMVTATALAQFADGIEPEMHGRQHAAFTVDLLLSDPYFYSAPITVASSPVVGLGTAPSHNMTFTLAAGATMVNTTLGISAQNTDTASVTLDCYNFTTTGGTGGGLGKLKITGRGPWMQIAPGSNTFTGIVSTVYKPAWL